MVVSPSPIRPADVLQRHARIMHNARRWTAAGFRTGILRDPSNGELLPFCVVDGGQLCVCWGEPPKGGTVWPLTQFFARYKIVIPPSDLPVSFVA